MEAPTITDLVRSVTKKWAKQRKAEERQANARARRYEAMTRRYRETIRDVAWELMEKAYLKASTDGTLPAHARQIMYAARGEIQERTGRRLDDQYFIQTLLVDYLNDHADETADWDVVFDARGHFHEPHTDRIVPLGTLDVRQYLEEVEDEDGQGFEVELPKPHCFPTTGPENRFGAILFIEKEGFLPLFEKVKLAERYDLAIMSTKGMSVTASRVLIDELCKEAAKLPLFVLHDFDKSGFSILGTLQRDTRRYEFRNRVEVIDLGLRLEDVKAWKLEAEDVYYKSDPEWNLKENGATKAEVAFLSGQSGHRGRRVELNAFASGNLVKWIEAKLEEQGVRKLIPLEDTLEAAYRRALEIQMFERESAVIRTEIHRRAADVAVPAGLRSRIMERLELEPARSWDEVLAQEVQLELEGKRDAGDKDKPSARARKDRRHGKGRKGK